MPNDVVTNISQSKINKAVYVVRRSHRNRQKYKYLHNYILEKHLFKMTYIILKKTFL